MRKRLHILTILGIGIYVIYSLVNRSAYEIPDGIAVPIVTTTMVMIVLGALLQQRKPGK